MTARPTENRPDSLWIVLPVKEVKDAKQRLAHLLSGEDRRALCRAMLEDVLEQVTQARSVDGILVVSSDPVAEDIRARFEVEIRPDPPGGGGLNGAVADAAQYLEDQGVGTMLVIHGDIPLVQVSELEILIEQHLQGSGARVTLVPDDDDNGTNVLLASPPTVVPFSYGPSSFRRHSQRAEHRGIDVRVMRSSRLGLDIDTGDDIARLIFNCQRTPELAERRTCQLLGKIGQREPLDSADTDRQSGSLPAVNNG